VARRARTGRSARRRSSAEPLATSSGHDDAPADEVGGGAWTAWRRCAHESRGWRADGTRSALPFVGARPVARPRLVTLVGHLGGAAIARASGREVRETGTFRCPSRTRGGAAGSRTRVPRSRRCGLYVRRFRIISDVVLRRQTASTSTPPAGVPIGPGGPGVRVEPRVVAPVPLRGVRGGTSRRVRPREPSHRWHLKVPARFVEVARASSARSPGDGLTTVETMSAPGWWRASARCSCQGGPAVVLAGPSS
jgi:hypothetical protein